MNCGSDHFKLAEDLLAQGRYQEAAVHTALAQVAVDAFEIFASLYGFDDVEVWHEAWAYALARPTPAMAYEREIDEGVSPPSQTSANPSPGTRLPAGVEGHPLGRR